MTDTLTKRNRDKVRKAFGLVIKKWEDGCLIEFAVPGDTDFLDELIEIHLSLLPNGISQDAHDMLYGSKEVNERIENENAMRDRVEETCPITITDKKEWTDIITWLIDVERKLAWTIEVFWDWNEAKKQKYEKLRLKDFIDSPLVLQSWFKKCFLPMKTDTGYIDYTQEDDDEEIEDAPVPVGAEIPWYTAVSMLELECSPRVMGYINKTKAVRLEEGCLTVSVPDQDTKDWLDSRVRSTAERLMIGICGEKVAVDFVIGV